MSSLLGDAGLVAAGLGGDGLEVGAWGFSVSFSSATSGTFSRTPLLGSASSSELEGPEFPVLRSSEYEAESESEELLDDPEYLELEFVSESDPGGSPRRRLLAPAALPASFLWW